MAGQKRAADDDDTCPQVSSSFRRRGPASSVGMPNLRLVVLTSDVLIDGRKAMVSAITNLFEATNRQVGRSMFAAPSGFGFEPQFPAGSGGNTHQTALAPNGLPLVRVPRPEEILSALGRGPRYLHDVLFELGLNPTRANEGYMPPRHFVVPPSTAGTHTHTSPSGRIPTPRQTNPGAALGIPSFEEASRNLPMVQQYFDLVSEEEFHLYSGTKAFLARCNENNIPVVVITDHQKTFTEIVKKERIPEEHIAMVMDTLTSSIDDMAGFYKAFTEDIVTRFEINSLPYYRHVDITVPGSIGTAQVGSSGGRQPGDEHKSDHGNTKGKDADIKPAGDTSMDATAAAGTATNTDTRAGITDGGPIILDDTPEPPTVTVTDSADNTSATTTDQGNAMKSKGKRPELEPLKITIPASSHAPQPRTPICDNPHTPTQPSGSFSSDVSDTPHTPTQRQLRRRAESPTTPTPPRGGRAHPRANMGQPAPTYSTPSHAPRVSSTSTTPKEVSQSNLPGSWLKSALGILPAPAPPTPRPIRETKPSTDTNTMAPPPRPRGNPPPKDTLMASSTPLHLQVIAQLIGAKKVWIKNQPGLEPRPRKQLPAHQDRGLLTLNTIKELEDYLFGQEEKDPLTYDMMDLDVERDVDNMEIFKYSAREAAEASKAASAAAVAGPPSLLPSGSGADKGKGKAAVNLDDDSDDDVEILEVRIFEKE